MPIGYLLTIAVFGLCTAAALAPPRPRHSSPSNLTFWLAYLVNEQPFLALTLFAASTGPRIARGEVGGPVGWAAAAATASVAGGLVVVAWRGARAGPALEGALAGQFGPAWRERAAAPRRRLPWGRILLAPFATRRHDVERLADLAYADGGRQHRLDVYRHRDRPVGGPVFVHFHGGAFRSGRKDREARPLLYHLASRGWVCVSANYRLSPAAAFPEQLVDAKRVIAWARRNAADHGGDASGLFVGGSSAGAHLAASAALTAGQPAFQPGFEDVDTSVTAVVALYGYYGPADTGEGVPSSPAAWVGPHAPPFFVAHGDKDTIVIVEDARAFVDELRAASLEPVVYAELPGGHHVFDLFHSVRFDSVVGAVEGFARWVLARPRPSRRRGAPGHRGPRRPAP